jgi:sugar lactone lactonase YvrE
VNPKNRKVTRLLSSLVLGAVIAIPGSKAAADTVDFGSDLWIMKNAEVREYLGRKCLLGSVTLKDVVFESGVIEVDLAVSGSTSYPGIVFRMQSEQDLERLYVRPHRAGRYPDAVQYTPVFNGIAGWQLYNGNGFTSGVELPTDQWVHLKLEVAGTQARFFVGDMREPVLVITDLKHGVSSGAIGLDGPRDGTSYFSDFSYRLDDDLEFPPPPPVDTPPGVMAEWMLSETFRLSQIDMERYPGTEWLDSLSWREVKSEPSGLVDVGRYHGRSGREPDVVCARKTIHAEEATVMKFLFGYSDAVSLFCNGRPLFAGSSAYRQRDPSFLGVVGLFDMVYLPLEKGENELLLMVVESFGGWGFMGRDPDAVYLHRAVREIAKTGKEFIFPETAIYDTKRKVFYVSNYDGYNFSFNAGRQYLTKVSPDGKIVSLRWIEGLSNPTGMVMYRERLFVVERAGLVEVDPSEGKVLNRYAVPGAGFLNDIAVDRAGAFYVSDSRNNVIYRVKERAVEIWLTGEEVNQPNGIHVQKGRLIFGNGGGGELRAVDLSTKNVETIALLPEGNIDGIEEDGHGNLLVSHYEGRLYRVNASGNVEKLLDTTGSRERCANFASVPALKLVAVPTFEGNRLVLYRLDDEGLFRNGG